MSEQPDVKSLIPKTPPEKKAGAEEVAGSKAIPKKSPSLADDDAQIPVEELLRKTRVFTERITNEDRQRLALELKDTGHQPTIQSRAPVTIQQFFTGEIDLDTELAKRFSSAPLLSELSLEPKKTEGVLGRRNASAILTSQDNAAMLSLDVRPTGSLEATFTYASMLSLRFDLGQLEDADKQRWIELMRRKSGISFLWTKQRWEKDYLVFVVREYFARVYAFSPQRFEAAARITPNVLADLLGWLESFWIRDKEKEAASAKRLEAAVAHLKEPPKELPKHEPPPSTPSPTEVEPPPTNPSSFEW